MSSMASGRLAAPRQRKSALPRPRLLNRLHAAMGSGLTVLHAPAGSGKSTLLASFVDDVEYNTRWLTLDASAGSPEVLAAQLGAALLGSAETPVLASAEKADDLRAYVGRALRTAEEASELPLLLVLDDAQEVAGSDDCAELLAWLLESLPAGGELILSGRALPPLREVERRIATGECLLLEGNDLAFTEAELALLLEEDSKHRPAAVLAATGGWPAGVMATLCGALPSRAGRSSVAWEQYLGSEIWGNVPTEIRPSLLRVAVPTLVPVALGHQLVGRGAWAGLANWLAGYDFLVEHLEDDALRLNPLLRDFLWSEFERTDATGFESTVAAVAAYLECEGELAGAIEVARRARHVPCLLDVVRRHGRGLLVQGAFQLLRRACDDVPTNILQANPLLDAMHARVLAHTERPGEALDVVDDILAQDLAPREAKIHALLAKYRALRLLGRPDQLQAIFDEARTLGASEDDGLTAELRYHEAHLSLALDSDFDHAADLLREAIALCHDGASSTLELLARSTLGQLFAMKGSAPAAVAELTSAARGWRQVGGSSNLGWVLNNLGMAHLSVGDFESAASALDEARREGEACENVRNVAYATASLGDAEMAMGHFDRAQKCFEEAIRLCAEEVPDESLASLSIAGLAGALLGQGDVQEADYFAVRALHIAETLGNPYEVGTCLLQHAVVRSAALDHAQAMEAARRSIGLFESIKGEASRRIALYRLALCQFRANKRGDAHATLTELAAHVREPWMLAAFLPAVREQPLFAQWVAARGVLGPTFRELLERGQAPEAGDELAEPARLPRVVARSLGSVRVTVGGREVSDEAWTSARAKELFFLFLANRDGLRKEEAVERLYPELGLEKCNSAFHSNLHRVRRALYQESVIKKDGAYLLNPEGEFEWDVRTFEDLIERALRASPGSDERATLHRQALELYRGPFAEGFYSEWAETLRRRTEEFALAAMSTLAGYYAGRSDFEAAAGVLQRLLDRSELNEDAAYQLATYRARSGNPASALAFLDDFGRAYRAEFREALPARFRELRHQIASGVAV